MLGMTQTARLLRRDGSEKDIACRVEAAVRAGGGSFGEIFENHHRVFTDETEIDAGDRLLYEGKYLSVREKADRLCPLGHYLVLIAAEAET